MADLVENYLASAELPKLAFTENHSVAASCLSLISQRAAHLSTLCLCHQQTIQMGCSQRDQQVLHSKTGQKYSKTGQIRAI
jgi:hypothetical protein